MFYDKSLNGFYYIDTLINGGAGFSIRSIFLSESNALGNLTVETLTAKEFFLLSDGELKFDKRPIENATQTLAGLQPMEYQKKGANGHLYKDAGFIAQDVQKHANLEYTVRASDMHMRYNPLIAYLVKGIQELNDRVTSLENKLSAT